MSSGLYSGVSGLALGIGLYRNVSGLWGGASGLINGFGGADPYAGASLYLNFLAGAPLDSRITFSRGTNATLVDSTGKLTYAPNNLILQSTDAANAAWTKSNTTVAGGVADPVGGTNAQTVTATANAAQLYNFVSISNAAGTRYLFSVWVRRRSGTGTISLFNPNATPTAISVTSAWTQFFVTGNGGSGFIYPGFLIASGGDQIDIYFPVCAAITYETAPRPADQVATTASAYYGPRFDYDPVTLAPRGLLIEEARTNLLTYSEQFDNAAWSKLNATITADAIMSPDGTINADLLTSTGGETRCGRNPGVLVASTTYTASIFGKLGNANGRYLWFRDFYSSRDAGFDLQTGTVSQVSAGMTASVVVYANGWFRCLVTWTTPAAPVVANQQFWVQSPSGTSPSSGTVGGQSYIWGAQLEAGSFATSYIPTVASTVTRNADVATMTGTNFSSWYNQSEGTFVVGASDPAVSGAANIFTVDDTTTQERIRLLTDVADPKMIVTDGNVTQANLDAGAVTANTPFVFSGAYKLNDFAAVVNGGTVVTDAAGTIPTVTTGRLGADSVGNYLNGHIRTIAYFNTRLPDAQLQTLTAPSLATTLSLDFTTGSYSVGF